MNQTTTLMLITPDAQFIFTGTEVPEKINFGGAQMLNTQKLVGGLRIVDAMGADDAAITWSGIFLGTDAANRAQYLDQIRRGGAVCTLTWESFTYTVIVSEFKADFNKPFWIQYSMTCQVVQDNVAAVTALASVSPSEAIDEDSAAAAQLADQLGSAVILNATQLACTALSAVTAAAQPLANGLVSLAAPQTGPQIGQTSTLSTAAASAILAASQPLASLQSSVQSAIESSEQTVEALPVLGYIDPSMPMAGQVASLVTQCNAAVQLPSLYQMSAVAARLQANLALMGDPAGNNQVVTGGGNLYQLAAQTYGDATRWTDIAQASGLSDPMTTGFNTVTVPQ